MQQLREKFESQQKQKLIASKQNLESIKEESLHDQLSNSSSKDSKIQWKLDKATKLKQVIEADEKGVDLNRIKNSTYTLDQINQWNERQEYQETIGKDPGFTDLNQLGCRKYQKLLDNLPSLNRKSNGETEEESILRLSNETKSVQSKRRAKYLKGSTNSDHDDDNVTFINDRNMKFNKRVARFYNKYTQDIHDSFERGTNI